MWFPVDLHSPSAQRGGLASAVMAALERHFHFHFHIIDQRKISNHQCDSSPTGAAISLAMLDACSAAYVGTSNMSPVAPFCAFTMAPELGVGYLEHLIDYEPLAESRFGQRWLATALFNFVHVLLRDHNSLSSVVLPLPIDGDPPAGFEQVKVDDRFHVQRIEPSLPIRAAGPLNT